MAGRSTRLEPEVVEITFRCRMGSEFVDDGPEIGQRADRGQSGRRANQAAERPEEQGGLYYPQGHVVIVEAAGEPLIRSTRGSYESKRESIARICTLCESARYNSAMTGDQVAFGKGNSNLSAAGGKHNASGFTTTKS